MICKHCKREITLAFEEIWFCEETRSAYCDASPAVGPWLEGEGEHEPEIAN
jgi:hypothetical protein